MIEVSGLSKQFGDVKALSDVSFKVEKGQIVGFLGANGAGKTTTMDILCGCIGPDHGTAKIAGFDVLENPIEAKRRLGYLPDEPPVYDDMKVEDFIRYCAVINDVDPAVREERVRNTIEKLSLIDVKDRVIGNLSKGYRQRVALGQALVHDPDVLVLDEPTEGLDPSQIVQIRELIRSLSGRHTIILSSHILSEVQNTCDQIVIIHKGQIVKQGTYEELVSSFAGGRAYSVRVRENAQSAIRGLEGLGDVEQVKLAADEETIQVTLAGDDAVIDQVARYLLDQGHGLLEISPETKSLEDVYFQLTK